ncbi:MAG: SpoIIE family protein phosphatase, partial [Firmicutes bacterium]|nr:SpoIIE family protein phosphatase [Bacillota bacterium]
MKISKLFQQWSKKPLNSLGLDESTLSTEEVFHRNEVNANKYIGDVIILNISLIFVFMILNAIGVFDFEGLTLILLISVIVHVIPLGICLYFKGEGKWMKYLLLISLILIFGAMDMVLVYNVTIVMVIPILLSSRYCDRKLTMQVAFLTIVVFFLSSVGSIFLGGIDLNFRYIPSGTELLVEEGLYQIVSTIPVFVSKQLPITFFQSYLPKLLFYIIITDISYQNAQQGYQSIIEQDRISKDQARVKTELQIASTIQEGSVPNVSSLKEHNEFDIAAIMKPAKEVGGDFYDFFYIDPSHLALMIADVSGKGVPAALFMMTSKIILDNCINKNLSPGAVLAEVNHQLCEKNMKDMFVTVWLGILDLETGVLVSANAGHEYPMLARANGEFEAVKTKHGLVLGGFDGIRYRDFETQLNPGDTFFVYTDGVAEANNEEGEQFGLDRTIAALNKYKAMNMNDLLNGVQEEIRGFTQNEPQFDDMTMLAIRIHFLKDAKGISVKPTLDSIPAVESFVEKEMEKAEIGLREMHKINISVDEMYSNVIEYSQAS